ncbi:hypothetical protein ES703_112541 [subsurface metagenome]
MKNIVIITIAFLIFLVLFVGPINAQEPIFSIRIIEFQSPVKLGEFLEFSYSTRGVSGINETSDVNFWIEKDGEIITSGSDTIYLGVEGKIRTADIFLPTSVESGIYELKIEVDYEGNIRNAYRTIEINIKQGVATINSGSEKFIIFIIIALIILMTLNIYIIYRIKRKKIKNLILEEERFIKRYKVPILILSFFLILGILVYYLNLINFLPGIPLYFYYLVLGVLILLVLFLSRHKKRKSK